VNTLDDFPIVILCVDPTPSKTQYLLLKLPFRSQLINFIKTYFKELAYIYYDKCF